MCSKRHQMILLKLKDTDKSFVCAAATADKAAAAAADKANPPAKPEDKQCKEWRKEIKIIPNDLES